MSAACATIEHMFEMDQRAELDRIVELQATIARAEAELAESMSAFVRSRRGSEVLGLSSPATSSRSRCAGAAAG